jgi:hypothetical protein
LGFSKGIGVEDANRIETWATTIIFSDAMKVERDKLDTGDGSSTEQLFEVVDAGIQQVECGLVHNEGRETCVKVEAKASLEIEWMSMLCLLREMRLFLGQYTVFISSIVVLTIPQ